MNFQNKRNIQSEPIDKKNCRVMIEDCVTNKSEDKKSSWELNVVVRREVFWRTSVERTWETHVDTWKWKANRSIDRSLFATARATPTCHLLLEGRDTSVYFRRSDAAEVQWHARARETTENTSILPRTWPPQFDRNSHTLSVLKIFSLGSLQQLVLEFWTIFFVHFEVLGVHDRDWQ